MAAALSMPAGPASAQHLRAADLPPSSVAYSVGVLGSSDFDRIEGRSVRVHWDRLVARGQEHERDGWRWGVGFEWEFTRPDYGGVVSRNRDLHRLQVPLMLRWQGRQLNGFAELAPGVATSSNVLSHLGRDGGRSDLMVSGRIEINGPTGARGRWLAGVIADRRLGRSRLYPTFGWQHQAGHWDLDLRLPDPMLQRRLGSRHAVVARLYPAGQHWHVLSKLTDATSRYFLERWQVELGWRYRPHPRIGLELAVGEAFGRAHRFDDDQEVRQSSSVASGPYLSASVEARWGRE